MLILIVLFMVFALFVGFAITLFRQKQKVDQVFVSIEKKLLRQYDQLPDWADVAESYLPYDTAELTNQQLKNLKWQAKARYKTVEEKVLLNNELQDVLGDIGNVLQDAHISNNDKRAEKLKNTWSATETQLLPAIETYNKAVRTYNLTISSFPTSFIAKIMKYKERSELGINHFKQP